MFMKTVSKNQALENQLKRTLADYQNLQKRVATDQSEFIKFTNAALLTKLFPLLDDLNRTNFHLKNQGLQLTIDKFKSILASEGVQELKLLNTAFDPKNAECLELVSGKKDYIIEIVQTGYTLADRVLRPARVKVGKGE